MSDTLLVEDKIVVFREASMRESVPHSSSSLGETNSLNGTSSFMEYR